MLAEAQFFGPKQGMENAPPGPVEPRPAASLIVVRRAAGDARPKILMARRGAGHRFMPNVFVFPGGAVDPPDYHAAIATPLALPVRRRLERSAAPELAQALAVAAARELTEEVGLSLGVPPALHHLAYVCRAITPADSPIRFDARFFLADAGIVCGSPVASAELEDPQWLDMEAACAANIARATRAVLGQLGVWLANPDPQGPVPVMRERTWLQE